MKRHLGWCVAASLSLASCTVGPDYRRPKPPMPATFEEHVATPAEMARTDAELKDWWMSFRDPTLDAVVDAAIAGNLDLRIATQRIVAARAMRNVAASAFYPQINGNASYADEHFSNTSEYPPGLTDFSTFTRAWELGPMLNWQIDVFGQIRRSVEAENANFAATIEQRRGVLVSLLGELVMDYAALRATQLRLRIAEQNVHAAQQALDLVNRTFVEGLGTSLQVAQQRAELETEQSTMPPLHAAIAQAAHALSVLTGSLPERLTGQLEAPSALPPMPPMPASLPSTVLENRPDVRRAERQYAEAVARLGVAVANRFPTFTIPIAATPMSSFVHILFQAASLTWQVGVSTTAPISTGGRLYNQQVAARARAEAARLNYVSTVLTAFREVEDGLVAYDDESGRNRRLQEASADNRLALQRATVLFSHGLTGFLDVLSAERSVFSSEDLAAQSDQARLQDAVRLFQAFGAGWQGEATVSGPDPTRTLDRQ